MTATATKQARALVSRAVIWAGLALGTAVTVLAVMNGIRIPRLEVVLSVLATWALLTVLVVVVTEMLRRHHRAIGRHAVRYGKRGAVATARHAHRHGRTVHGWLMSRAAPRWENREHRPLMFRRLRGEPEDPEPQEEGTEGAQGSGEADGRTYSWGPADSPSGWPAHSPEAAHRWARYMSTDGGKPQVVTEYPPGGGPGRTTATYVNGKPAPDHTDTNGGTTSMAVSKITPDRRARRTAAHTGGSIPAERLPLPVVLLTWPAVWGLHQMHVPGHDIGIAALVAAGCTWATWARHDRARRKAEESGEEPPPARMLPAEAALVAAGIGGWMTAAVTWGPLGRPAHLLTWIYLAGAIGGYVWLRKHEAVQAARRRRDEEAAWIKEKAEFHQIAPLIGLSGWHLQSSAPTELGREWLVVTSPTGDLASRVAGNSRGIEEKLAHVKGLPYGRVDVNTTDYPGQLVIGIRTVDLSTRAAAYHPMTSPWPDSDRSPFADWFPETTSIRNPVTWGFSPEDGSPLTVTPFSSIGGRVTGVIGMTGSGKSNLLNNAREAFTRMPDARLVQLNGAHMGDELTWEPLSALTLCGPVATDEEVRTNIAEALSALCLLVTQRSATLADTGHSTFQPTPDNPAVCVVIDEVDEIVKHVPGAGQALEFLASKQRKSAVALLLATQRAVIAALGGGMVRANMSEVLVGKVARASESRHATGAETEIPDIREYAHGEPGYFQRWDPHSGTITGRGRAFLLGKPPEELAYMKRIVAARRSLRDWSIPDMPPLTLDGGQAAATTVTDATAQEIADMRGRLASIAQAAPPSAPPAAPAVPALRVPLAIPQAEGQILLRLLASPEGTTAAAAGQAIGKSKWTAYEYLTVLKDQGVAELTKAGRSSRYRLAGEAQPEQAARPGAYVTLSALAEAVHAGRADGGEAAEVLEKVWEISHRAARPRLTLVPPPPEGDVQ